MKKEPEEQRFEKLHSEDVLVAKGTSYGMFIFRDKQTGVLYLFASGWNSGGLTPLLDAEGKPIVEKGSA